VIGDGDDGYGTVDDVLCAEMCLRWYCPFYNEVHI
jgi:hypothetical protein